MHEQLKRLLEGTPLLAKIGVWAHAWRDRSFDWRHNVRTAGIVRQHKLALEGANALFAEKYEAVDPRLFRHVFGQLALRHQDFVFIDFGSGMGRALLLASEMPFRHIIGVEFSETLHQIAMQNVERFRSSRRQGRRIEPILGDATRFEMPDQPCVLFFNNPFQGPVLQRVLENAAASVRARPRPMFLVYIYPEECEGLLPLFERGGAFRKRDGSRWWTIFETPDQAALRVA